MAAVKEGVAVSLVRRIVVVDDNRDAADTLAAWLRELGHEVMVAYDGASALARIAGFQADLAFIDIEMPVMDGYELAVRIRGERALSGVRLVALTGYGRPDDRRLTDAAGFALHLLKPIDPATLEALLRSSSDAGDSTPAYQY